MKLRYKKNVEVENYDYTQRAEIDVENQFKHDSNTTIFQIIIWFIIVLVVVVLSNKFYLN